MEARRKYLANGQIKVVGIGGTVIITFIRELKI